MKGWIVAISGVVIFAGLIYLAFRPASKPATLGNQIAQSQQIQGTSNQNSQEVKAIDYTLETFNGKQINFSAVNSQKPVVIQIWATWCEVCEREFPENNKIAQKYKDQIEYHAVNIGGSDQTPKAIGSYVKRKNLDSDAIKFLVDMKAEVSSKYGFRATPQHLFVAKDGVIKYYKPGYMSPLEMEEQFQALIQN
ncbi:MAG: hypothetical protein COU81_03045 [Candidatus Portnoybacteria bacterium CG10_big_fil_rev_8_21_14_0_10_36_7]|uniref:Thioredoxin domain-containing protein n=1 Tax=Candidatus Portnoybacteria bacterium CG10_big_fil_rev_8_21_14_0_10_36_7 TaxID=1974812 RepID=A0A2M8KDL1_9BACT|nr:MAG: hypothetical protein COU81_03045 [Candidatus Portnoybacteria bacterium CG10_big_fil_rev_8_21_14_0_10_36_7]